MNYINEMFKPFIGKNVIENLTVGMYDDPRFVYREYIQNSADAIDKARQQKLVEEGNIYITIDSEKKRIEIEDNATGIEQKKVLPLIGNIAQSKKQKGIDKGFRGIGRLGGLGYCEKLIFETSFYGEDSKSIMTWDAKMLRKIFNDENVMIDAAALISIITDYSFDNPENSDAHYFKVTMENVTNATLLDIQQVRDYLSMVAPVPFNDNFIYKDKIKKEADGKVEIDEYKIVLNGEQIYKAYKNTISNNYGKAEIIDVEFFEGYNQNELLYWGWYGVSNNMYQISDEDKERGFRLRKSNIQIGLETTLDKYHKEKLGNRYFVGEIYAINKELIPNARRDFFIENDECEKLKTSLEKLFSDFKKVYYDFSKKNTAIETIQKFDNLTEKLNDKSINQEEKEKVLNEIKSIEKKVTDAKKTLLKLAKRYEGQVLGSIIKEAGFDFEEEKQQEQKQQYKEFNTQKIIDKNKTLSPEEELLLQKIYTIIRQNFQIYGEELIQKIDEEVRK